MGIINSSFRSVVNYLQDDTYYVPEYQREYSWEEEELEDFWLDLIQLHKEDYDNHFLGQIVIHTSKEDQKKYIIDGQQRSSTVTILLDNFRELFEMLAENYEIEDAQFDADDITSKYIGRLTAKRNDVHLVLGKNDRDYFANMIQKKKKEDKNNLTKSEERIKFASEYFKKKLEQYLEQTDVDQKYEKLSSLYNVLVKKFNVMYVETDDINEAFIIFETLNARGKDLETSDLLKNHLFRISNSNIEQVNEMWERMIDQLGKTDTTRYIRHYWNSQYNFVREKDLYKALRKEISNPQRAKEVVKELRDFAEVYGAFDRPSETKAFENVALNEAIENLHELGARSFYPIILAYQKFAAVENLSYAQLEKDMSRLVRALTVLIVRNFVVAGKVANRFETEFARIAYGITREGYSQIDEIIKEVNKLTISDEEFKVSFGIFTIKKKNVIRYLYREIHNHKNAETRILRDNNKVHIEHIMPQNKELWAISNEEHEHNLWRFGNLTLLGEEYNKGATNHPFADKKEVYSKSKIDATSDLLRYEEWGQNEIDQRQKALAEKALHIWSRDL